MTNGLNFLSLTMTTQFLRTAVPLSAHPLRILAHCSLLLILFLLAACSPPPPPPKPQDTKPAPGKLEAFHLTEIQEGDKRWLLKAEKADFLREQHRIHIRGIHMEFYGFSQGPIRLTCEEGVLDTRSREVTLQGQVKMEIGDLRVNTDLVTYQPAERLLLAPENLLLEAPNFTISGKELCVDIRQRHLKLTKHQLTTIKMARRKWPL